MVTVKIRTSDIEWAKKNGLAHEAEGKDGVQLVTVQVPAVERVTFASRDMIRFDLTTAGANLPRDYPNRWVMTPATYVVA